jgi:hypothetical protein
MVGIHAGDREKRFGNVETIHVVFRRFQLAPFGVTPNRPIGIFFVAEEIAVERQNAAGAFQLVLRRNRLAKSNPSGIARDGQINRFVKIPTRFRKFRGDDFLHSFAGRRTALLEEKTQPFAVVAMKFFGKFRERIKCFSRSFFNAAFGETHRAIRIVEI